MNRLYHVPVAASRQSTASVRSANGGALTKRRYRPPGTQTPCATSGVMLVECLIYIGLIMVVMGAAMTAFYRYWDHSRGLKRAAEDIARTLKAGERWRADVRLATAPLRLETEGREQALCIPQGKREITYFLIRGDLWRLGAEKPSAQLLLDSIQSSHMISETRHQMSVWRWEVELRTRRNTAQIKPLFSFEAVPGPKTAP